jgi:hypothetical protein
MTLTRKSPMKRTGFKKPAAGMTGILRTTSFDRAKPRKAMKSKRKPILAHELAYFKRVAALPCAECGIWGYSQAAHSNRYQDGKGRGIKAHYKATFPLCSTRPDEIGCHVRHDQCIGMTREEADERTTRYIENTLRLLGEA